MQISLRMEETIIFGLQVKRLGRNPAARITGVHPVSGRKVILPNPQFTIAIENITGAESQPLLSTLFDLAKILEYQYRLHWPTNTLGIWDNRTVQHSAVQDYHPQRRRMKRITIGGDELFSIKKNR